MSNSVNTPSMKNAPRRGRPPSATARAAILAAARDMLEEGGLLSITMEGVAARAGVGKPTVYRHWDNRYELAMATLLAASEELVRPPAGASSIDALRHQLIGLANAFASGTGRHVAALLASGYGETELSKAFRSHFVQARRNESRVFIERAIEAGQLRRDVPIEIALDIIYGPIFYRLTMAHAPVDAAFVNALLDELLAGLAETGNSAR
jgi:AcrR family transcriptional regulator